VLSLQDHFQDITGYTGSDRSWVRCLLLESIYWRNTPIMRRQIPDRTRPMEVRQHSVGIIDADVSRYPPLNYLHRNDSRRRECGQSGDGEGGTLNT
jgi:hypothetical protein